MPTERHTQAVRRADRGGLGQIVGAALVDLAEVVATHALTRRHWVSPAKGLPLSLSGVQRNESPAITGLS